MAPYAVCTTPDCGFVFDFCEDVLPEGKSSLVPPAYCQKCSAPLLTHCPVCFISIGQVPLPGSQSCDHCGAKLLSGWRRPGIAAMGR